MTLGKPPRPPSTNDSPPQHALKKFGCGGGLTYRREDPCFRGGQSASLDVRTGNGILIGPTAEHVTTTLVSVDNGLREDNGACISSGLPVNRVPSLES